MKSYFAKLAARATLANAPVSSPAKLPSSPDPFENTSVLSAVPTPRSASNTIHLDDQVRTSVPFQSSTAVHPERESHKSQKLEQPSSDTLGDRRMSRSDEPQQKLSPIERSPEPRLEPPLPPIKEGRRVEQDTELDEPTIVSKLAPTVETIPTPPPMRSSDELIDSNLTDTSLVNEQSADVGRQQSVLLQKADVFMSSLFERRKESTNHETAASDGERQESLSRQTERAEPSRLQPIRAPVQPPEQVNDRSELVIGKLTVEVVPQAPPPPAQPRQIVVVRGSRSGRSVMPSSRRFGLSQF